MTNSGTCADQTGTRHRGDKSSKLSLMSSCVFMSTGCRGHFRKERFTTFDVADGQYDYNSVMHYGSFFFARERGLRTLRPNIEGERIGQREKLSALDVQKGLLLYQCL